MKNRTLGKVTLHGAITVAMLAGCGGGVPPNIGSSLRIAPATGSHTQKHEALLYVSAQGTADVYVFTYPGGVLKQTLSYFDAPAAECVDGKGDVFVADSSGNDIVEFAHGGTAPIATLADPGDFPFDCSVDPKTGNLAVTSGYGEVLLYARARGSAKIYTDSQINNMIGCTYDSKGNLFVDGDYDSGTPIFAELRAGAKTFTSLTLDRKFRTPGLMQWDGSYLAVGDQKASTIYLFGINNFKGTTKGSVHLDGSHYLEQFWIDGPDVAAANGSLREWAGIWKFPAGGKPIVKNKNLCKSNFCLSVGATISE